MANLNLPNIREGGDIRFRIGLEDGGVAVDWSGLEDIRVFLYADAQKRVSGECEIGIDVSDHTVLGCFYSGDDTQYRGINSVLVRAKYQGEIKVYDKPAINIVARTSEATGVVVIDDPVVPVQISVEDVSTSLLDNAIDAAILAAARANEAAEAAEHMVDIHTGPAGADGADGKSAYELAVEEGYTGTEEEWLASLEGPIGATPDISIGTVTTVEPGTPASASMTGTPEAPVLNLSLPKGAVGSTPNISVGTVTTGAPGTPVVITITGTAEAPVLNITIPQGLKGDTGVSADYPITIYNGLDSSATDQALAAFQGKVLNEKVNQLEADMTNLSGKYYGVFESAAELPEGNTAGYAFVGTEEPLALWNFDGEEWNDTGINIVGLVGPKGEQGEQGIQGIQGPAGVTTAIASVDNNTGTPSVDVSISDGVISFTFHNIKGAQGNSGYSGAAGELQVVNNTTQGGATDALSAEMGKELQEEIDGFFTPATADLDIADENGAVLARFENGGFRVKNFDSAKAPQNGDDIAPDFAIVDENAKAIVVFRDGHIQTKNFDSETLGRTWFYGKKVSIIGDSISTAPNHNAVEFTVLASDISQGRTLQGYPTYYDINTKIGTKTVTSSMVGVLTSFTPGSGDEGKTIGKPLNYNSAGNSGVSSYTETWWHKLATALGMEVLQNVSWSGASVSSHEGNTDEYKTSYAWHPAQINKLAKRDSAGGTITPDVVIIYRGTNDMTHSPFTSLTDFGADAMSIPDTDYSDSSYDFKVAYCMTIKKIREAYPQAKIIVCTLNLFKRLNDTQFPTNNGYNTLPEYNNAIREVADIMGCGLIEFDKDGITFENCYPTFISDDSTHPTHPNPTGHTRMAEKAIIDIKKY